MKSMKKNYIVLILVLLIVILGGLISYGMDVYRGNSINIQNGEVTDGDLIGGVNRLVNKGIVTGDLILGANEVRQMGIIEGDLISAASDIILEGIVKGDIRLAAKDIRINGEVNRNASMLAGSVLLEEDGVIDGSIHVFAGDLDLRGFVGGDIIGGAGTAIISGTVKGNVKLEVDKLYLEPGAMIEGNLTYISNEELNINPEGVKGEIKFQPSTRSEFQVGIEELREQLRIIFNVIKFVFLVTYILIGLILIKLFQKPYQRAVRLVEEKPLYSAGIGFSILVGVPMAAIILLITFIGIPVSALLMFSYGILIYFSKLPVALWLGQKILRDEDRPYVAFAIGSLLIATLTLIPYVGFLTSIGVTIVGIGATLIIIKRYYKKEYEEKQNLSE